MATRCAQEQVSELKKYEVREQHMHATHDRMFRAMIKTQAMLYSILHGALVIYLLSVSDRAAKQNRHEMDLTFRTSTIFFPRPSAISCGSRWAFNASHVAFATFILFLLLGVRAEMS